MDSASTSLPNTITVKHLTLKTTTTALSLQEIFERLAAKKLYAQITTSVREESGYLYYYLKVFEIREYCDTCRMFGKKYKHFCNVEVKQHSIHMEVYYGLDHLFDDVLYILNEVEKPK